MHRADVVPLVLLSYWCCMQINFLVSISSPVASVDFLIAILGVYMRFHFGAKWNIFISVSSRFLVTVYMIQPEMKLIAGVISLRLFWQKWNFVWGDKISCKHYPKWNHLKGNICTRVNKNDWLLLNELLISGHSQNETNFIAVAMKNNVNRISFMMGRNFVSGIFHIGSHVNILLASTFNWFGVFAWTNNSWSDFISSCFLNYLFSLCACFQELFRKNEKP